jgi:DNA-binding Lrp family transcriptional regulator
MDDTDRKLLRLIEVDPRMPLKELAKKLGISRQAADHRVRILTKLGAFKNIKAEISINLDRGLVFPLIWGTFRAPSVNDTLDRLGESEFTVSADVLGGGVLSVFGCLRNESELDGYVDFVKRAAEMPEPIVGLVDFNDGINPEFCNGGHRSQRYTELTPLDFRIIASLHEDGRKPLAEVADEVGASMKTVRRHIERMRSEGSLDFHSPLDFPPGEDMFTFLFINLRSGADKVKVGRRLLSKYPLRIVLVRSLTNIPDFLRALLSSDKMSEIRMIIKEIGEDEDIVSVRPNLIYFERDNYETHWNVKELKILASTRGKGKEQHLSPEPETR